MIISNNNNPCVRAGQVGLILTGPLTPGQPYSIPVVAYPSTQIQFNTTLPGAKFEWTAQSGYMLTGIAPSNPSSFTWTGSACNFPRGCTISSVSLCSSTRSGSISVNYPRCTRPTIGTITNTLIFTVGTQFSSSITINNATSAAISGLPTGIEVQSQSAISGNYTFLIAGVPTTGNQSYNIKVRATNTGTGCLEQYLGGFATDDVSINTGKVTPVTCIAPVIPNLQTNSFTIGVPYSETLIIENATNANPVLSSSGTTTWPSGITHSGVKSGFNYLLTISGTPRTSSSTSYNINIVAINALTTCNSVSTTKSVGAGTVLPAPAPNPVVGQITKNSKTQSNTNSVFQRNYPYIGTITIQNATSATIASGLPSTMTFSGAKSKIKATDYVLTITGTPTTTNQEWNVLVNATNNLGNGGAVANVTNVSAGSGVVAPPDCPAPQYTSATLIQARVNVPLNTIVNIRNATKADLDTTQLISSGLTATVTTVPTSSNLPPSIRVTITGTPTKTGFYAVGITPYNDTNTCFASVKTKTSLSIRVT